MRATPEGRAWLARLPRLAAECAELWALDLGEPYPYAYASLAVPAWLPDGRRAVLKICFPDRESEHEAEALARWGGNGAVRLLERDLDRRALLVEHCSPGTPLSAAGAETALDVLTGLLPRLWIEASEPFRSLEEEAALWAGSLRETWEEAGRPFEQALLDEALQALFELRVSQGEPVLVNQDLHTGNVLRAEREPWLVIDPKPLVGEREFNAAPILRSRELCASRRGVLRTLDLLTSELGLDRERVRRWALGQTIAWAWENGRPLSHHVELARRLASA
jgi:streptomycin 6-kinase